MMIVLRCERCGSPLFLHDEEAICPDCTSFRPSDDEPPTDQFGDLDDPDGTQQHPEAVVYLAEAARMTDD